MNTEGKKIYMMREDNQGTVLLHIYPDEENKVFLYDTFSFEDPVWVYKPELDRICDNRALCPEYIEISEEQADKIKKKLDVEHEKAETAKNVIHVEHHERQTANGVIEIDVYYKDKERRCFKQKELVSLLNQIISMDAMIIQEIHQTHLDIWGYEKRYDTNKKEDVLEICGEPLTLDAFFIDNENHYRFRYSSRTETVKVARWKKNSGMDIHSVFKSD